MVEWCREWCSGRRDGAGEDPWCSEWWWGYLPPESVPPDFYYREAPDFSCKEQRHNTGNDHVTVVMEEWGGSGGGNGGVGRTHSPHTTVVGLGLRFSLPISLNDKIFGCSGLKCAQSVLE